MFKVLIPTKLNSVAKERLENNDFIVVQDTETPLDVLITAHPDAGALIVRSETIDAAVIDAMPKLQLIVRAGAGYNTIDTRHARRRGIDVMNTPGANANAVAEEVVALILAAYRRLLQADSSTRQGLWEKKALMGRELAEKTVGIVGLGNIGRLLVHRLTGFDNTILAYDPVVSAPRAAELGVKLCSMQEVFSLSDIVSLHIPETDETRGIVNRDLLEQMKPGAMLVNCARAGVINEDDLRAVKAERSLLFCNDVYPRDEPGEKSVADIADIMVPHIGANTEEANINAANRAAEQLIAYVRCGVTTCVVNRAVPEGLDEAHQLLAFYLAKVARHYLGCDRPPRRLETSFYGDLRDYATWLTAPIVSGISADFDPYFDFQDAAAFLTEKGIELIHRDVDDSKRYGESMTIDLVEGRGDTFKRVSIRGTVAEGIPMVSRIDDFERLYFDPQGRSVLVVYEDRPGMLAKITSVIGRYDINIDDIRCPQDTETGRALAVLKVNRDVPRDVIDEIRAEVNAERAVFVSIK